MGEKKWGVFDIKDKVWLGDDKGPKLFTDQTINGEFITGETLAKMSAQMAATMLGVSPLRIQVRLFNEQSVTRKDEVDPIMTGADAIKHLEKGGL